MEDEPFEPRPARSQEAASLFALLSRLMRRTRLLLSSWALVSLITVAGWLLLRDFSATASFAPEGSGSGTSSLLSLAARFGVSIPQSLNGQPSLEFYAALPTSRAVLDSIARTTYRFAKRRSSRDTLTGTIADLYRITGDTPVELHQRTIEKLESLIEVRSSSDEGLVRLKVTTHWPLLSEQIARQLLALVNAFDLTTLQSRARAERQFVQQRLAQADSELTTAENRMQHFLEENHSLGQSPALQFESDRLRRRVDLRQQVYVTLAQAFEQARLEEVRNTPVITIIEAPEDSGKPSGHLSSTVLIGTLLGGITAVTVVFAAEYIDQERHQYPDDYAAFRSIVYRIADRARRRS